MHVRTPTKTTFNGVSQWHMSSKSPYNGYTNENKSINTTSNQSYRGSAYIPSAVTGGGAGDWSVELLQARIEHLERERVDLSLKIHQKDEKDRTARLRMENLETQIRNSEESRFDLQGELALLNVTPIIWSLRTYLQIRDARVSAEGTDFLSATEERV